MSLKSPPPAPSSLVAQATNVAASLILSGFDATTVAQALVDPNVYPSLSATELTVVMMDPRVAPGLIRETLSALLTTTNRYSAPEVRDAVNARFAPPVIASLVRRDFGADCVNSDIRVTDPSSVGGSASVVRTTSGTYQVWVTLTSAVPNSTYHFFLKCVQLLGDIQTDRQGRAEARFAFPANLVGPVFAFDMYPEGAPRGNKFQSTQVNFASVPA